MLWCFFVSLQSYAPAGQDPALSLETAANQETALLVHNKSRVFGAIQVNVAFWHRQTFSVQCVYTWV